MRLFYAAALPPSAVRAAARCAAAARDTIPGRYVPEENYHITLAYIGCVPPERLQDAHDVLLRCAAAFPRPHITLKQADYFGHADKAVLILRAAAEPSLAPLHDALVQALAQAGLPCDPGPFSPHVTLARRAAVTPEGLRLASAPLAQPVSFTAQEAKLCLSARDEANVLRYTPLRTAPFL